MFRTRRKEAFRTCLHAHMDISNWLPANTDRCDAIKRLRKRDCSREFRNDEHVFGEFILKEKPWRALALIRATFYPVRHTLENKRCRCTSICYIRRHRKCCVCVCVCIHSNRRKMTKIPSRAEERGRFIQKLLFSQSFTLARSLSSPVWACVFIWVFRWIFVQHRLLCCISNYVPAL